MFQENVLKYVLVFNICGNVMFLCIIKPLTNGSWSIYHVDTEPLHHSLMYSLVSLLSGIYPFHVCIRAVLKRNIPLDSTVSRMKSSLTYNYIYNLKPANRWISCSIGKYFLDFSCYSLFPCFFATDTLALG